MKPEFPPTDQEKMVSPHAQEVEYALNLQRMITTVMEDPSQLRQTIYEFARARLIIDTDWAGEEERQGLAAALETAITGVEAFSVRREEKERLTQQARAAQITHAAPPPAPSTTVETVHSLTPEPVLQDITPPEIILPHRLYSYSDPQPLVYMPTRAFVSTIARFCVGVLLFALVVTAIYYKQRLPELGEALSSRSPSIAKAVKSTTAPTISQPTQQAALSGETGPEAAASSSPSFPLPTDYGVYALSNNALSELNLLPLRVPDRRIAMSAPINEPSRTTLADGKLRFIIFRRDLVGSAPDRIEVRVVARVVRALTFDAKGRPNLSPVSDNWNIRNVAYDLRVRPIAGHAEMLLVQSDKADFTLPAGRYILVLKEQGYDFTVGGQVTDLAHCLERTDAANGSFYSECLNF
jgi:hypothetical protein